MSRQLMFRRTVMSRRRSAGQSVTTSTLGGGAHYQNQPSGPSSATTPDQGAFAPGTSQIDLRVKVAMVTWTPSGNQFLLSSWSSTAANSRFALFIDTAGKLNGAWYTGAAVFQGLPSTAATGFAANATSWVRALLNPAAGTIDYYTSTDGTTWTPLGTQITGRTVGAVQTPGASVPLTVGATGSATGTAIGKIYAAQLLIGVTANNTFAAVDFSTQTAGSTSFAGVTGETWTLSGSAAIV